jgi:tripartite-type tricarboxylate transporter receptor subunit TctC
MSYTRIIAASFALAALSAAAAEQTTYPTKPIRWIVPFGPGGAADIVSRIIAPKLSENVRQQVVVDNRQGGGTIIATELLANAAGDGYTVMLANISFGANPALHSKLPYDTIRDFTPLILADVLPNILLTHPSVPAKSLQELIALGKSKPGYLNYGSAGVGSSNHLNMELFKKETGIDAVHVPYQSGGQLINSLVGAQVHVTFISVPPALAHVKAGKLRIFASTGATRIASFPDVPTIGETVKPGFVFYEWHVILAPKGVPKDVVAKLNAELNRALTMPDVKERLGGLGAEVRGGTPEEAATYVRAEVKKWLGVVKPID